MRWMLSIVAAAALAVPASAPAASKADLVGIDQPSAPSTRSSPARRGKSATSIACAPCSRPTRCFASITPDRGLRGGTLEDYIAKSGPILEKEGFTEHELGRRVELYGNLATVWSSYDGRTASGSFHERGINSFQLVKVDGKWLVASILWQEEGKRFPLPKDMIRKR